MILALIVLIPLCIAVILMFKRFSPKNEQKARAIRIYNITAVTMSVVVCVVFACRTYIAMINTSDRAWWPVIATLGGLFIFVVGLCVGMVMRALVFRK